MKTVVRQAVTVALAITSLSAYAADAGPVMRKLDDAATKFKSAQADFEWQQVQAVVPDEPDIQKGSILFARKGTETQMAAQVKEQNGKPDAKDLLYKSGALSFYQPSLHQMTIFQAGQNKSQYESFLTLGFGGSGKEIEAAWTTDLLGSESINGTQVAKINLVPKQDSVRNNFSHVIIWVDPARGVSLKQQFFTPGGDTRTALYTNIRYNQNVPAGAFTIKTAPGTQTVQR